MRNQENITNKKRIYSNIPCQLHQKEPKFLNLGLNNFFMFFKRQQISQWDLNRIELKHLFMHVQNLEQWQKNNANKLLLHVKSDESLGLRDLPNNDKQKLIKKSE